jgi:hypothetical protein
MSCDLKIVVFDLDETLGYFMQLGMFWDAIKSYIKYDKISHPVDQKLFDDILNLYPEFLRPNIINILNYLKIKKQKNECNKLMVYTNNQGPPEWAKYIIGYFEKKINYELFDQIIAAFKVNGKQVEVCRTTHLKTHNDFIRCTKLPKEAKICFLDDVFYPGMSGDNIYYINIKPYVHDLPFDEMIERFIHSRILDIDSPISFKKYILEFIKVYNYYNVVKTKKEQDVDNILSKKILNHLHIFFNEFSKKKTNKTREKRSKVPRNRTVKKRT